MTQPKNFPQALGETIIVLESINTEQQTKGGLIVPKAITGIQGEGAKGEGIIMAVGPDVTKTVLDPKTGKKRIIAHGDRIIFNHYADKGINFDNGFYLVMHQLEAYVFLPDETSIVKRKNRVDRRRAAVEKRKTELQ